MDVNPYLLDSMPRKSISPGKGIIEVPGGCTNIIWQTRKALPTDFENHLADTLERVFAGGATEINEVVDGLNSAGCVSPTGQTWTEAALLEQLKTLGQL